MKIISDEEAFKALLEYKERKNINNDKLASIIGVSRKTIYNKMKSKKFKPIEKYTIQRLIKEGKLK